MQELALIKESMLARESGQQTHRADDDDDGKMTKTIKMVQPLQPSVVTRYIVSTQDPHIEIRDGEIYCFSHNINHKIKGKILRTMIINVIRFIVELYCIIFNPSAHFSFNLACGPLCYFVFVIFVLGLLWTYRAISNSSQWSMPGISYPVCGMVHI